MTFFRCVTPADHLRWASVWGEAPAPLDSQTESVAHELAHLYFAVGSFHPTPDPSSLLEDKVHKALWTRRESLAEKGISRDKILVAVDRDEIKALAVGILVAEILGDPPLDIEGLIQFAVRHNLYSGRFLRRGHLHNAAIIRRYMRTNEARDVSVAIAEYLCNVEV